MEIVDIELSEFTRRSRSVLLTHSAAGLGRGLEYGERILLHSDDEYRAAVVADIDFDADDTHYRLVLGGVVPAELALERGEQPQPALSGRVSVHDLADMMARSAAGPRIPQQRRSTERLLFEH